MKCSFPNPALYTALLGIALFPMTAWGHGGHYRVPTEDELAQIQAPLVGAPDFAFALSDRCRGLMTTSLLKVLDDATRHFTDADRISRGHFGVPNEDHAAFNRWKGDTLLQDLVRKLPAHLTFDVRPDGAMPTPGTETKVDGQSSMLLLKCIAGDGPIRFVSQDFQMQQEHYAQHYTVPVEPTGTTYALLHLKDVTSGLSNTIVALKKVGDTEPFAWYPLQLDPKPKGQLAVTISDEKGDTTPALVRLVAQPGDILWPPPNAVNFQPMINDVAGPEIGSLPGLDIFGPGRAFEVRIPGAFAGHYWVVPGGFEIALPEGAWEISIIRGVEHIPVKESFEIKPAEWTRLDVTTKRWTDSAAKGWYSGDDHIHSRLTNSEDARKLLTLGRATDVRISNILEMGDSQRTYYTQRGFGKDFRVEDRGYWLVPGQEDPRSMLGHNIGMNLTGMVRDMDKYLLLDWIAETVHQQGGLFGQTHVGQNACEAHRGMALLVPRELYDFYSIMQGGLGTELYYDFLDLGYKLTATAGSDTPYGGTVGNVRTYAHLGSDSEFTPDAWFDTVKAGHTFVTNGPMLEFSVNGVGPGEELVVTDDTPLSVKAQAYGLAGESAIVGFEIVKLSESIETLALPAPGETSVTIETQVNPDNGFWIAARAWGANGSAAHTTPVYVRREGFRHWNVGRVAEITERQLAILDEIESVVAHAEAMKAKNQITPFDFFNQRIAQQGEALRERLDITRNIYRDLQAMAKAQP